ncbi:hypothetical protein ACOJR9_07990 [Alteromonas sp. A081]|uniref:hypothetical protein n=1 Tax=Alteromonas sp. A081 TaxID=3410269 RepID=UPI003B983EF3
MKKILLCCLLVANCYANASFLNFDDADITNYGVQAVSGTTSIFDGGFTLSIDGNLWVDIPFGANDVPVSNFLSFDFKSDAIGEVHGIGFDNDDNFNSGLFFQLGGTQTFGRQDYRIVLTEGEWTTFNIDLSFASLNWADRIVFAADNDAQNGFANSMFRNISIRPNLDTQVVSSPTGLTLIFVSLFATRLFRR